MAVHHAAQPLTVATYVGGEVGVVSVCDSSSNMSKACLSTSGHLPDKNHLAGTHGIDHHSCHIDRAGAALCPRLLCDNGRLKAALAWARGGSTPAWCVGLPNQRPSAQSHRRRAGDGSNQTLSTPVRGIARFFAPRSRRAPQDDSANTVAPRKPATGRPTKFSAPK